MKTLLVSVIIQNWNGIDLLKICLPSLSKQTFKDFEVILVDNGSKDGSVEFIEKKFPKFKIIKLLKNIGFSPAVNRGIKMAKGKYIVLINNDTRVDRDCLINLVTAANKHPQVGMVAAKMLQYHKPNYIDSTGDYIDPVGHENNMGGGKKDGDEFKKGRY